MLSERVTTCQTLSSSKFHVSIRKISGQVGNDGDTVSVLGAIAPTYDGKPKVGDPPTTYLQRMAMVGVAPLNQQIVKEAREKEGSVYLDGAACFVKDRVGDVGGKDYISREIMPQ